MIQIKPLDEARFEEAAELFAAEYGHLRDVAPELPARFTDPSETIARLGRMAGRSLAAFENGRFLGYLSWWLVDRFRGSARRGAYAPEWSHGAVAGRRTEVYRALYRAAAAEWAAAGCAVHAITLLAHDQVAREAWFWSNFGLAVVDASRPVQPLDIPVQTSLTVRQATADDAEALSALDAEHVRHYAAAPVFMAPPSVDSAGAFREFLARPKNSIWMAWAGPEPAGFMRFTGYEFDAVAILESESAAFCNGLFVRPAHRGRRAAAAMLDAALVHYSTLGFDALYTNFESFNPEAAAFWPRYFRPVCLSMSRIPERAPAAAGAQE